MCLLTLLYYLFAWYTHTKHNNRKQTRNSKKQTTQTKQSSEQIQDVKNTRNPTPNTKGLGHRGSPWFSLVLCCFRCLSYSFSRVSNYVLTNSQLLSSFYVNTFFIVLRSVLTSIFSFISIYVFCSYGLGHRQAV